MSVFMLLILVKANASVFSIWWNKSVFYYLDQRVHFLVGNTYFISKYFTRLVYYWSLVTKPADVATIFVCPPPPPLQLQYCAKTIHSHISITVYSRVLIYAAGWSGASWRERKCTSYKTVERDLNPRLRVHTILARWLIPNISQSRSKWQKQRWHIWNLLPIDDSMQSPKTEAVFRLFTNCLPYPTSIHKLHIHQTLGTTNLRKQHHKPAEEFKQRSERFLEQTSFKRTPTLDWSHNGWRTN